MAEQSVTSTTVRASSRASIAASEPGRHEQRSAKKGGARRHTEQLNDVAYVNAEKTTGEVIQHSMTGMGHKGDRQDPTKQRGIPTQTRSVLALRNRAVEAFGGFDLRKQERGDLTSINSACLAFSRDGKRLAVGEHHGRLLLLSGRQRTLMGCRVQLLRRREQGKDRRIRDPRQRSLDTKRTGVSALAFSPDSRWLAAGLRGGNIKVWDTQEKPSPSPVTLDAHKDQISAARPSRRTVPALVSGIGRIGLSSFWDLKSGFGSRRYGFEVNDVLSSRYS